MIIEQLKERNLPELLKFNNGKVVENIEQWQERRKEIKNILSEEEYGYFPKEHFKLDYSVLEENNNYCAGNAIYKKIELTLSKDNESFSFPIDMAIPKKETVCPLFIYMDFYDAFPSRYVPVEEICDKGFAVISFYYKNVSSDDNDFSNGLSKFFYKDDKNREYGKILVWAWAAMHVMDYVQTLDEIDKNNIVIVGHSRLGKTALLTGAFDERFNYVISNNSGQSGAAISRKKGGERIKCINSRFPYWFCSNYNKYSDNEDLQAFDQHYLLSLIAPRHLYVASASEDKWADPNSEFLSCVAVDEVYKIFNKNGFLYEDRFPNIGEQYNKGYVGYHLRKGCHYLSRYDWNLFMEYIKSKMMN